MPLIVIQSTGRRHISIYYALHLYLYLYLLSVSFKVNLPVGCSLKNVRPQSRLQSQPKRGLLTSLWRQYANF